MRLTSKLLGAIILVFLFGGISATSALNLWRTESSKVPAKYTSGEAAGLYNPDDIRGSYTFADIYRSFHVPVDVLSIGFGLPVTVNAEDFSVKNLESLYSSLGSEGVEIGTSSVRLFVALYAGLPFDLTGDIYLPSPAVDLLRQQAQLTDEQMRYLADHSISIAQDHLVTSEQNNPLEDPQANLVPAPVEGEEHPTEDRVVKGKTTFREVLDWGVPKEKIAQIIGAELPNPLTTIRGYCTETGIEFSSVKEQLTAEIGKLP